VRNRMYHRHNEDVQLINERCRMSEFSKIYVHIR